MSLQNNYTNSFPLEFKLSNQDQESILYISNDLQSLSIEINNVSENTLSFNDPKGADIASFFHLTVKLKTGTLDSPDDTSKGTLSVASDSDWTMGAAVTNANNTVSLNFQLNKQLDLQPGESTIITINNIYVQSDQGSRVTQMQFSSDNLVYADKTDQTIQFSKTVQLGIINQRGKKNIPLHVCIVGSNTVLNDGKTPSELLLRFTNTLDANENRPELSQLNFNFDASGNTTSKFVFGFLTGEASLEDALGTNDQVANITIVPPENWAIIPSYQSINPEWSLSPAEVTQTVNSGEQLDIPITNIISGAPIGTTYLKIDYYNIPGYWDGSFMVPIHKQPLLMRTITNADNTTSNNVGINTANPTIDLAFGEDGTGIKEIGEGELAIYSKGSEKVRLTKDGHLCIGTQDPVKHRLAVYSEPANV
jgi:hypothetical protein